MRKCIVYWMNAIMLVSLPEFMKLAQNTLGVSPEASPLMSMIPLLNVIAYTMALIFGFKGAFELYKFGIYGGETISKPITVKKSEVKIEKQNVVQQEENIYTGSGEIDNLIDNIKSKAQNLLKNNDIKHELEYQLMCERALQVYMPKIVNTYKGINSNFRYRKNKNGITATAITIEQLNTILKGLEEVENNLFHKSHNNLRVNEKFLKEIFKKSYLEMEA